MAEWEKDRVMYFIRSPERISSLEVPKMISLLHESDARIAQISYMNNVPVWVEYDEVVSTEWSMCDGTQIEFTGEPKRGFDLAGYVSHISDGAVVSQGKSYEGTHMSTIMVPNMLGMPAERHSVIGRFEKDVMMMAARMDMGRMSGKQGVFEAGSNEKDVGLADLLWEAEAHGMRNTAFYHVFAGIPVKREPSREARGGIVPARGTEIIASSPVLQGDVKFALKEKYPVDVYVGGKLVA